MKVVFIKDLGGQAKVGDVKEAKSGYARNFLFPQGYAVLSTDPQGQAAIKQLEVKKAKDEAEMAELREKIAGLADLSLTFAKKLTAKGGLFSAVKASDIEKEFEAKTKIKGAQAQLEEAIKEAGEQAVEVKLPHGMSTFVNVVVVADK